MVIEITKRYIVGECTLDKIVENFIDQHFDGRDGTYKLDFVWGNEEFSDWLEETMNDFYDDETVYNDDVYKLKEYCEKAVKLEIEKEKLLDE